MEGLFPYIYRTLRRSRRSSRYLKDACPSAGASQWFGRSTSGFELASPPPIRLGKFSTGNSDDNQASSDSVYFFSSRTKDGGGRSGSSSPGLFAFLSPRTHEV